MHRDLRAARCTTVALLAATLCAACTEAEARAFERFLLLLVVLICLDFVVLLTVLIVGIARLLSDKPSIHWGVAAIVLGVVHFGLSVRLVLVFAPLVLVGVLNVRAARARLTPRGPPRGSA